MAKTKVKEFEANPLRRNGDKANCPICTPKKDRIPHDRVWTWSLKNGRNPLKETTRV